MNESVVLCIIVLFVQTSEGLLTSPQNLKTVDRRMVNGFQINQSDFNNNWYFTATLEIWHNSHAGWLKHPVCLGTFLEIGEIGVVVTAADCFFPRGYDHTQFSYLSRNNYRVFLGVVRIRYGYFDLVGLHQFAVRSTVKDPLVVIHPEWKFNISNERKNIATVSITHKCIDKLNVALANGEIGRLPHFRRLQESEAYASGYCKVVGWEIDWHPTMDVFDGHVFKSNFLLGVGVFLPQDTPTCNHQFSLQHIRKAIENSTFCIIRSFGECVDLYLTEFEYGSGVICDGVWSGFVSDIRNRGAVGGGLPTWQLTTVSSAAMIRRFVSGTRYPTSESTCSFKDTRPAKVGRDYASIFMPNTATDYAAP